MKYVIGTNPLAGHLVPVVFPEEVSHVLVAAALVADKIIPTSAGFVHLKGGKWAVAEERSESTGLGPKPDDEKVLNYFLGDGLAGLELSNVLAYERLTGQKFNRTPAKIFEREPTTVERILE